MEPVTTARRVGAGVSYCRTLRGMQGQQLAEAIGRSTAYVSRIEHGHRQATAGDLMAFAHVLNVPLEWLRNPPVPPTVEVLPDSVSAPSGPQFASGDDPAYNVRHLADGTSGRGKLLTLPGSTWSQADDDAA